MILRSNPMAHSKQAKKRVRQNEKRRVHNRVIASRMRTELRRVIKAAETGDTEAVLSNAALAMKRVDKACKSNLIHKNAAARQKSRIARAVAQARSAAAGA